MWHFLSTMYFQQKRITHNFFTSYHGHSMADAHAAADKRLLRAQYDVSELDRKIPSAKPLNWGPSSAADLAHLLGKFASKTQSFTLPFSPRDEQLKPNIRSLKGIKSRHSFIYENDQCRSFEQTNLAQANFFTLCPCSKRVPF